MNSRKAIRLVVVSSILTIYVLIRFWKLTDSCLWFDEIFSVHAAEHDWGSILAFVAADLVHPPLFYLLLRIWILVGGNGLFWLRLFPVVFSVTAIVPLIFLLRELKANYLTVVTAIGFLAINGSLIKYSQEVRMYSMFFFLSLTSIWLFARYFNRGKGILLLTIVNISLVYTHYFGWTLITAEFIAVVWYQRIKLRAFAISVGAVFVAFSLWIGAVVHQLDQVSRITQNIGWMQRPGILSVVDLLFDVIEPFYFQASSIDPATIWYVSVPLLALTIAMIAVCVSNELLSRESFGLAAIFIVVPVVIAFVASWITPVSIWGSRHLILVVAPAIVLISICLSRIRPAGLRYSFVVLLIAISLGAFLIEFNRPQRDYIWCAWEVLAALVPNDSPQTVYAFEDLTAYHIWFARRNDKNVKVVKVNGIPGMTEDTAYFLPREFDDVEAIDVNEMKGDHFWLAFRDMTWNERHPPVDLFVSKGYSISGPIEIDAQRMKAFLVEVKR